jgi:hypothetical protein
MNIGTKENEVCNRDGCLGVITYEEPENCYCHISAPCSVCENLKLVCPKCGMSEYEDCWLEENPE